MRWSTALVGVLLLALPAPARAGDGAALHRVARFDEPVYVTAPPGDRHRLFVVERSGRVRIVRDGRKLRRPFLDLSRRVLIADPRPERDQRGMLSMAFSSDYAQDGRFYVFYVDRTSRIRVDELRRSRRDPDRAAPGSRRTLLRIGPIGPMHHGGQLQFGPDGLLYVSTGYGDDPATSQDPHGPWGKLLRLDPAGRHPRAQVYASGLRNPWRFSFDREDGRLIVADVGESAAEELDVLPRGAPPGANFGWDVWEGGVRRRPGPVPGYVAPVLEHRHAPGAWCAIIGGYVVRDPRVPALEGTYLYGDLCSGWLWRVRLERRRPRPRRLHLRLPYLVSFGEDGRGRVYAVSLRGGVYRVVRGA